MMRGNYKWAQIIYPERVKIHRRCCQLVEYNSTRMLCKVFIGHDMFIVPVDKLVRIDGFFEMPYVNNAIMVMIKDDCIAAYGTLFDVTSDMPTQTSLEEWIMIPKSNSSIGWYYSHNLMISTPNGILTFIPCDDKSLDGLIILIQIYNDIDEEIIKFVPCSDLLKIAK